MRQYTKSPGQDARGGAVSVRVMRFIASGEGRGYIFGHMPELPDLLYIAGRLQRTVVGRTIRATTVKQPVVIRNLVDRPFDEILIGREFRTIGVRGPFLRWGFSEGIEVVINLMLAGRLQHQQATEKPRGFLCLSLGLDDGTALNICDDHAMTKVYIVREGDYASIPKFALQGIDILSPAFTPDAFRTMAAAHTRRQVRVFINDHSALSAIGNAYADEILFEARIHPKTFVSRLSTGELELLYTAIRSVIAGGTRHVENAGQPIEVKVRTHMKVRNRKGEPCPRCGTTIRREGVRGHDVFFCPACQPSSRPLFINWEKPSGSGRDRLS